VPPRSNDVAKAQLARLTPLIDNAIDALRQDGHPELSAAVRELADRTPGWGGRTPKTPVSFKADPDLMKRIATRFPDRPVTAIAEDGARRFLAGDLTLKPVKPSRSVENPKTKVNIRVDVDLLKELEARCAAMSDPEGSEFAGWRIRPMHVYIAALEEAAPVTQ
jgi:uncharacterized protein (DUF4415 family)